MKLIMLIMYFINRINATSEGFRAKTIFNFQYFSFISCSVKLSMKKSFIAVAMYIAERRHLTLALLYPSMVC